MFKYLLKSLSKALFFFGNKTTLSISQERTKNTMIHIFFSLFLKALNIAINFLLVPLTIGFVGLEQYGIWLAISSIFTWFSLFDLGLGHGLRNKLCESLANENIKLSKIYVSTTYALVSFISVVVFIVFLFVNVFVDWSIILNVSNEFSNDLRFLFIILLSFFSLQLVLRLITTILFANQKPSIPPLIYLTGNIISLILLFIVKETANGDLITISLIMGVPLFLVTLLSNFFFFQKKYFNIKPSINFIKKKYFTKIGKLGVNFFILQLEVIIIFQMTNFLIIKFFSAEEVVIYNLAFKYFSVIQILFAIMMNVYWSAITEALEKKDFDWIISTVSRMKKIWFFLLFFGVAMLFFANKFYLLWVGPNIKIPFIVSLACYLSALILSWNSIYEYFLNGAGKIRVTIITATISLILYAPIAYLYVNFFELGISGLIFAISSVQLINAFITPLQYSKIIKNEATGIWNK